MSTMQEVRPHSVKELEALLAKKRARIEELKSFTYPNRILQEVIEANDKAAQTIKAIPTYKGSSFVVNTDRSIA